MTGGIEQRREALRDALRDAMREGFAAVGEPSLGPSLRKLFDAWAQTEGAPKTDELSVYREALEQFDRLGRQDRSVLVARGMRLCAAHRPEPPPAPPKRRRQPTAVPEAKPRTPKKRAAARKATPSPPPEVGDDVGRRSVSSLRGVGPATAKKLEARGLRTLADLAFVIPSGYEDRRRRKPLSEIEEGETAVIEAEVGSIRQGFGRGRFMASIQLRVTEDDEVHEVTARWFHRVGGLDRWAKGGTVLAIGPIRRYQGKWTMAHPELRDPAEPGPAIGVRYPAVEGIPARTLARVIRLAAQELGADDKFVDALPESVCRDHGLPTAKEALDALHCPSDELPEDDVDRLIAGASPAHRRLAFDEFFFFQLALLLDRERLRGEPAHIHPDAAAFDRERLRSCLPFEPTGAQWRVLEEIETDLGAGPPMLRLLQGDVGSGKTAVAFASAVALAASKGQTALMAPTEILAEQHLRTLQPWCAKAGLKAALLTGATPRAERTSLLALLGAGKIDVLVGTHALLTDDVNFAELGLVIVDEQHRFGVQQRAILRRKGALPHLLVLTATPIPRTMALCAYGQLDVSVIDELPPGRKPAVTKLSFGARGLTSVRKQLVKRVEAGARAFVVCPLVEASDALDVTDVEATASALRELMPGSVVELIHGRMSSKDKEEIMRRFRQGEADVLVATTVIEVGVDVPDATVMVVEHAERFGLAQLHQLRGRVGRGKAQAHCLLHTGGRKDSEAAARLQILTETSDGFAVAEHDLANRGPGEMFGTRQAGAPRLRFAGFAGEGTKLLVSAREAAGALLAEDPQLAGHPEVAVELQRRGSDEAAITADAG